jgi:quinolinate synthase
MTRSDFILPPQYAAMADAEASARIARRRSQMGADLLILAHHYQRDEIVAHADAVGDSLLLSRKAAQSAARHIVFCGVHFMAESADVLTSPGQAVYLPDPRAGCTMSEMADAEAVASAMDELAEQTHRRIVPVTYVNSSAAVKAITGERGGACCTSSNVRGVFEWALLPQSQGGAGGDIVLALPDGNLGYNTAVAMGFAPGDCVTYDPALPRGGVEPAALERCRFVLWKGFCYVHQRFTPEHVRQSRAHLPGVRVIVHPECPPPVVALADASGSTEQIIAAVAAAQPGSKWAIGTESNLVRRLARQFPDRTVAELSDAPSLCRQMNLLTPARLLSTLDALADGRGANRVVVPRAQRDAARLALDRMLRVAPAKNLTQGVSQ